MENRILCLCCNLGKESPHRIVKGRNGLPHVLLSIGKAPAFVKRIFHKDVFCYNDKKVFSIHIDFRQETRMIDIKNLRKHYDETPRGQAPRGTDRLARFL